ncbi:hypothetical protein LEP1GSC036_1550 [Leptospira weilii str. 2006001853]|uniref:Uncharacterized protein n=1 Tax=Leptospira weilii str. 2006001853 TaxID=1001589 RepID=A0A828YV92_9LEPT
MLDLFQKSEQFWIRRDFASAFISLQKSSVNFWYHFYASE